MCYYSSVNIKQLDFIRKLQLPNQSIPIPIPAPVVNGFLFPGMNVITAPRVVEPLQWGLIPSWVKDAAQALEIRSKTLNARFDTLLSKPSFRSAYRSRRCLIPVTGFFEWRNVGGKKYPYYIRHASTELFSLAGIHEGWTDRETGEHVRTFSVVTTHANPFMARVHNSKLRMPLILDDTSEQIWLNPRELEVPEAREVLHRCETASLRAHPVAKGLQQAGPDANEEALREVQYPELILDPI